jgi:hypothetical protein
MGCTAGRLAAISEARKNSSSTTSTRCPANSWDMAINARLHCWMRSEDHLGTVSPLRSRPLQRIGCGETREWLCDESGSGYAVTMLMPL